MDNNRFINAMIALFSNHLSPFDKRNMLIDNKLKKVVTVTDVLQLFIFMNDAL